MSTGSSGGSKFAVHRGQRIAYRTSDPPSSSGPAGTDTPEVVVLQHGLFSRKNDMKDYELAFQDAGFRVLNVDSLGHGKSDRCEDPVQYRRELRAGDICAVLDAEKVLGSPNRAVRARPV